MVFFCIKWTLTLHRKRVSVYSQRVINVHKAICILFWRVQVCLIEVVWLQNSPDLAAHSNILTLTADPEISIFHPFFLHLRTSLPTMQVKQPISELQRCRIITCYDSTSQNYFIFKLAAFRLKQRCLRSANSSTWGHLIGATKVCPDSFVSLYDKFGSISNNRLDKWTSRRYSVCPCLLQWHPVCGPNPRCFDVVFRAANVYTVLQLWSAHLYCQSTETWKWASLSSPHRLFTLCIYSWLSSVMWHHILIRAESRAVSLSANVTVPLLACVLPCHHLL